MFNLVPAAKKERKTTAVLSRFHLSVSTNFLLLQCKTSFHAHTQHANHQKDSAQIPKYFFLPLTKRCRGDKALGLGGWGGSISPFSDHFASRALPIHHRHCKHACRQASQAVHPAPTHPLLHTRPLAAPLSCPNAQGKREQRPPTSLAGSTTLLPSCLNIRHV